jgi:hypothetical protein
MARIIVPKNLSKSNLEIISLLRNHFPDLAYEKTGPYCHNFFGTHKDDNQTLTPVFKTVGGRLSIMGFACY